MQYLEMLIGAAAAFLAGFAWYSALFGKVWQAETGITDEDAQTNMLMTHGIAFLMMCAIAYFTYPYSHMHPPEDQNLLHGAFHGAYTALKYAIPVLIIHYLYQKKSWKLMLIDGGYAIVFFAIINAVTYALKLYKPEAS